MSLTENQEKIIQIHGLLEEAMDKDPFLMRFFDPTSEKNLDLKIKVLKQIKAGVLPADIPEYYTILERYPKDGSKWD